MKHNLNDIPPIEAFETIRNIGTSAGHSPYEKWQDANVVIITHEGRVLFPRHLLDAIGNPEYIAIQKGNEWIRFTSTSNGGYTVQGGGKQGMFALHCTRVIQKLGMVRKNYKCVYPILIRDKSVYLNQLANPLETQYHIPIKRKQTESKLDRP